MISSLRFFNLLEAVWRDNENFQLSIFYGLPSGFGAESGQTIKSG